MLNELSTLELAGAADVHEVCCDAAVGLCGAVLPGADRYVDDPASCVLCEIVARLAMPCGAPGCEVGLPAVFADLADLTGVAASGRCRVCGCTDDTACPGGCRWVPDPAMHGELCSACTDPAHAADVAVANHDPDHGAGHDRWEGIA